MMKPPFVTYKKKETFNFKQEILRYTEKWKWFLLSIIILVTLSYFHARNKPVVYETSARIKIINQKLNEIELPGNLKSLFDDSKVNQENEIEIIKSYRILENVVKKLNLNIRYYVLSKIKTEEIWEPPFKVYAVDSLIALPIIGRYFIDVLEKGYLITDANLNQWKIKNHQMDSVQAGLPFLLKLDSSKNILNSIHKKFKIRFFSNKSATLRLLSGLNIEQVGKYSEVLKISLRNESSRKSEAIINEIIAQFDQDGIKDRKLIFQRTIDFVNERFEYLKKELEAIEIRKKIFKEKNNLTDINLDTEHNLSNKSNSNTEKVNLETQLEVARILKNSLLNKKNFNYLPANVGLGIAGINDQIIIYNKALLKYNKLKISGGSNNPIVKNVENSVDNLRQSILHSVISYQIKSEAALKNIEKLDEKNQGFFHAIPKKEKILRAIEREQTIKENLFIFLLQRREEAAINLVITAPTVKVVDYAITNLIPVSESPKMLYAKAFIAGLVLPFIIFYLIFFVDTRIHSKEDLYANISSAQIIGSIPFNLKSKIFNGLNDGSQLAEDFRILRTNINFLLKNSVLKDDAALLMVTSTKNKEGKTFCAVNLAIAYAVLGKKTLLIEADFRNPKLDSYLNNYNEKGLSNYLQDEKLEYKSLIKTNTIGETNFDVLFSGNIPIAPAEVLSNGKIECFISAIKNEYDFIIFDTAPTELYTDTFLISDFVDTTIYVTRAGYTDKKDLEYSEELIAKGKLNNVSYIFNFQKTNILLKNKRFGKRN